MKARLGNGGNAGEGISIGGEGGILIAVADKVEQQLVVGDFE